MVLARDLRFDSDELERLAELLVASERCLRMTSTAKQTPVRGFERKCRLELLEQTREKIDQGCVMI